jgi:hypothetical protein
MTPEQIHDDLRALRAALDKTRDDSAAGLERVSVKLSDLHVQVASLQAQREFGNAALQAMVKIAIHEALSQHLGDLDRRVKALEDERLRIQGMTSAGRLGVAILQLPGVGAALYLLGKAGGLVP